MCLISVLVTVVAGIQVVPKNTFEILKCNFHTHTTYSDGHYTPTQVVNIYSNEGYDVLAITDHNTIAGFSEAYLEGQKLGMTVICGEEVSCLWSDGDNKHVVSLFNNEQIGMKWTDTPVETIFDAVHEVGGIGIVAHPWIAAGQWVPYRNASYIDGWEATSSPEDWVYTSGLIYLLNHDFHDLAPLSKYWTYILAENNTVEGVKDALLAKRIVTYCDGKLVGSPYALSLYIQNEGLTSITATLPTSSPESTLAVSVVGMGTVNKSPDLGAYDVGSVVTLTAVPAAGWTFSGWGGDLTGSVNPANIIMDGEKAVTAIFAATSALPSTSLHVQVYDMEISGSFQVLINGNMIFSNPTDLAKNDVWTALNFDITSYIISGSNIVSLINPTSGYTRVSNVMVTVGPDTVINDPTDKQLKLGDTQQYTFNIQ